MNATQDVNGNTVLLQTDKLYAAWNRAIVLAYTELSLLSSQNLYRMFGSTTPPILRGNTSLLSQWILWVSYLLSDQTILSTAINTSFFVSLIVKHIKINENSQRPFTSIPIVGCGGSVDCPIVTSRRHIWRRLLHIDFRTFLRTASFRVSFPGGVKYGDGFTVFSVLACKNKGNGTRTMDMRNHSFNRSFLRKIWCYILYFKWHFISQVIFYISNSYDMI